MDRAAREALAHRLLELAGDVQLEAMLFDHDLSLTRFTQNAIHQNVAQRDLDVRVRAVVDGRQGVASNNGTSDAALAATIARARALAELAPRDPDFPGLAANASVPAAPEGAFVAATAEATPEARAAIAKAVFDVAERDGLWAAGYVTTERSGLTIASTTGLLASFDGTECGINVKQNGSDSTGFAEHYANDVAALDGTHVATVAAQKALASRAPRSVEPGAWTVILEPPAFGELLAYLTDHFSAQAYDEGSSFLSAGLERAYAGANVTLRDDYAHPLAPGMPFDYEGSTAQRIALLEAGVAKNVVTDAYYARKLGRPNTGHALPAPNARGPEARHVTVDPGTKPLAQLIAETERGLLISRFWYIRPVDQRRTIVTGMTRDGTFLIEGGKLTGGVRNMRFNQSILEALSRCEFSNELARTGGYSYSMVVPAAKIEGFTFSSGTDF